jgi:hypothetical protein
MEVYLQTDKQFITSKMAATHATVKQMARTVKGTDIYYIQTIHFLLLTYIMT